MNVSYDDFQELKKLYNKAVKDGITMFQFKGQDLLTSYAKYLIE